MNKLDVVVIGAGAAGLMCAIEAAKRGKKVLVIDHANKPGKKILMSGGGRCNFTNYYASPDNYLSHNQHFCKSALKQYTQWDFINLVQSYKIKYYEKTKGQLFCVGKSKEIVNMLLAECEKYRAEIRLNTAVSNIEYDHNKFTLYFDKNIIECKSLVIASGGLSIPTMGASPFGYKVAEKFGHNILPTRAGLVPFTLNNTDKELFSKLSGISIDSEVKCNNANFREGLLFTHRGISGPSILQISSYWHNNNKVFINLLPDIDLKTRLFELKNNSPDKKLVNILAMIDNNSDNNLPKNLINIFIEYIFNIYKKDYSNSILKHLEHKDIEIISSVFNNWTIKPNGTEGYRTAEVTLGGVDVNQLSSKTMESNIIKGLYFIGEVVDVTGWLGGYNFQWAWSSGWVCGNNC